MKLVIAMFALLLGVNLLVDLLDADMQYKEIQYNQTIHTS